MEPEIDMPSQYLEAIIAGLFGVVAWFLTRLIGKIEHAINQVTILADKMGYINETLTEARHAQLCHAEEDKKNHIEIIEQFGRMNTRIAILEKQSKIKS